MTEKSFRRFSEVCLEKIIISFFHGLLNMVKTFQFSFEGFVNYCCLWHFYVCVISTQNDYMNAEIIERMALDEEALEEFFKQYTTPQVCNPNLFFLKVSNFFPFLFPHFLDTQGTYCDPLRCERFGECRFCRIFHSYLLKIVVFTFRLSGTPIILPNQYPFSSVMILIF